MKVYFSLEIILGKSLITPYINIPHHTIYNHILVDMYACTRSIKNRYIFSYVEIDIPVQNVIYFCYKRFTSSQQTFSCSMSTIETLEKGVNYVQS